MTRTRLLVLLSLAAVASATLVAAASAAEPNVLRLTEAKGEPFPTRSFVLTLPRGVSPEGGIQVFENGEPVSGVSIVPIGTTRGEKVGTVLAIDASESMLGAPIQKAMEAARAFAAERRPAQQLGALAFNAETELLLPLSADAATIERSLAGTPRIAYYTRMYEALDRAIRMIRDANLASGSIVLLSDGQELGSQTSPEETIAAARAADIRIFSVGLRSRFFDDETLQMLARRTGGEYREAASPEALTAIFEQLGSRLANEYLLRYRSLAGPDQEVHVAVRPAQGGQVATVAYRTPKLPATPQATASVHHSPIDRVLQSGMTVVILSLIVAGLLAVAVLSMVRPRESTVLRRLGAFVSVARPERDRRQTAALSEKLLETTERSLRRRPWWDRFKQEVEIAEVGVPAEQIVVLTAMGTVLLLWVLTFVVPGIFAAFALLTPFVVNGFVRRRAAATRKQFADQLPDNLQVLASALRAGHSLVGALAAVIDDAAEPSKREFRRVIADEQLGIPLEDSLTVVAERMKSRDLEQVAVVAALQRQTGGNSAEVLDRVAETVRERAALRRLVRTLTAQGRMARWVLSALPVGLLVLISLMNRTYMTPLYERPVGQLMLAFAAVMVLSGSYAIKRIVDIKV